MIIKTRLFDEITVDDGKIIHFAGGIVGFPDLKNFALVHDDEKGSGNISFLLSVEEPAFAMPVIDPLIIKKDYNPKVEDNLLNPIGSLDPQEMLVLVTITVPSDITKMSINLKAPIIINASEKKGCQIIVEEDEYPVKYPIYELLQAEKEKAGE